jgi:hypothetical protein
MTAATEDVNALTDGDLLRRLSGPVRGDTRREARLGRPLPRSVTREGTTMASTSAPEFPAWLDLETVIPTQVLDKVIPTQVLEAMHEFAEDVQALKCKIADLGQTGSELDLEYERYLDKAFGSVSDEASDGLRELVHIVSGYRRFRDSFLEVSVPLSAWTDCPDDDPSWLADHKQERRVRWEARFSPFS